MKKTISKTESKKSIEEFFSNINGKSPKEVRKIKKLAMSQNIKLGSLRKKFCKKCLNPYSGNEKTRIKNKMKGVVCEKCGSINMWKLKVS